MSIFNGSYHIWNVSGRNGISNIKDSVASPSNLSFISLSSNSTVSNQNAMQVQLACGTSNPIDSIMIVLTSVANQQTSPYISSLTGTSVHILYRQVQ
jgi:hypothetical protein